MPRPLGDRALDLAAKAYGLDPGRALEVREPPSTGALVLATVGLVCALSFVFLFGVLAYDAATFSGDPQDVEPLWSPTVGVAVFGASLALWLLLLLLVVRMFRFALTGVVTPLIGVRAAWVVTIVVGFPATALCVGWAVTEPSEFFASPADAIGRLGMCGLLLLAPVAARRISRSTGRAVP